MQSVKKSISNKKIIVIGSFYFGPSDVVEEIIRGFYYNRDIYTVHFDPLLYSDPEISPVRRKDQTYVVNLKTLWRIIKANKKIDAIFMIAGGIRLGFFSKILMRLMFIKKVSIQLSDPDDFTRVGKKCTSNANFVFTNSPSCVVRYKRKYNRVGKLNWGTVSGMNKQVEDISKKFDFVIVGGFREDRIDFINNCIKAKYNILICGDGWKENSGKLMSNFSNNCLFVGHKVGFEKFKLIKSAKYYISFSETMAGYHNLKYGAFEALSVDTQVISDFVPEPDKFFKGIENLIFINSKKEGFFEFAARISEKQLSKSSSVERVDLEWKYQINQILTEIF
jgi:hypothetical protein